MTESPSKAVCDAGPIIHLDEIGTLYLIEDFHEILIGLETALGRDLCALEIKHG
jgi:hypothetical protein